MKRTVLMLLPLALSGCVTARMHSEADLNVVGQGCGLALGELFQDEAEKKLLFLMRVRPSFDQRACVIAYARRNHLKPVFIDALNMPKS